MPSQQIGKPRNALVVLLLSIITLGIYGIVWYYLTFHELKRFRGEGWSGGLALVFILVPFVNIVSIAIPWLLPAYVGRAFVESGQQRPISGLSGFWIFVPFIGGLIWFFVVQGKLNQLWRSQGAA